MEISHQQIVFLNNESTKEIFITNNSDSIIIFKMKTNCMPGPKAQPIRGFVQIRQTKTLKILRGQPTNIKKQTKMLLYWGFVTQKSEKFDQCWAKVDPSTFQQKFIPIVLKPQDPQVKGQNESKSVNKFGIQEENSVSMKSSSMSFDENPFNQKSNHSNQNANQFGFNTNKMISSKASSESMMINSVTNPMKRTGSMNVGIQNGVNEKKKTQNKAIKINQTQFVREQARPSNFQNNYTIQPQTNGTRMRTISQNQALQQLNFSQTTSRYYQQPRPSSVEELSQLCFVQSQLLHERQQCQRLKEQLRRNKELERERDEMMRQYTINKSMRQECQHEGVNWQGLVVLAVIFLTVGFLISRF